MTKRKVRTSIQPGEELEVDQAELSRLHELGLVITTPRDAGPARLLEASGSGAELAVRAAAPMRAGALGLGSTHDIQTTMRPDQTITVGDAEYQQLLAEGLVYSGSPQSPAADSYDLLFADKVQHGSATPAALRAAFVTPRRPRLATVGDSIAGQYSALGTGGVYYTTDRSALAVANALLGNRFDVIGPSATLQTFALGGQRTDQLRDAGYYAGVVAADVDGVFEEGGTNDIAQGVAAATIVGIRTTLWDQILATGKFVVAATIPPLSTAVANTAAQVELRKANKLLRAAAVTRRGVYLLDWYPDNVVPSTGVLDVAGTVDGTHPNGVAGSRSGAKLAAILDKLIPGTSTVDALPVDDFNPDVVLTNSFMGGTTGVFTGTYVAQGSGTLPTGAIVSPLTATSACVASIVPRTDCAGNWLQMACTATGPSRWLDGYTITFQDTVPGGRWNIGDTIYMTCELETDAAGWDGRAVFADANCFGPNLYTAALFSTSGFRATATVPIKPPPRMTLISPHMVIPASTTRLQARFYFYGGGTARISRFNIVRVQ